MIQMQTKCVQFKFQSQAQKIGVQYFNSANYNQALKIFIDLFKNTEQDHQNGQIWRPIIQCYRNLGHDSLSIIQRLQQLFEACNNNFQIALNLAQNCLVLGLMDKASAWFEQCIRIDPKFKQSYLWLSDILMEEKKIDQSIALLEKYRLNNPLDEQVLQKLCDSYNAVLDNEESASCYDELIKIKPQNSSYYFRFVQRNAQSTHFTSNKCWNYLELGAKLKKNMDYQFYSLKGLVLNKQGKFGEAIQAFKKSISLNDKPYNSYAWYSQALIQQRQMKQAIQLMQKFVANNPMHAIAWQRLAHYYWHNSEFKKVPSIIQYIQSIPHSNFTALFGKFYLHSGLITKAIEQFQSIALRTKRILAKFISYRRCCSIIGDWEKVVEILLYKRNLNKLTKKQKVELGEAYLKLNQIELCNAVIEELQADLLNHSLKNGEKVLLMGLMLKANQLEKCMQIYDSHLIVSHHKLYMQSKIELQMILIQCHYRLNEVLSAFRIYEKLYKIVQSKQYLNSDSLIDFIEIQIELLRYEEVKPFYEKLRKNIEKKSADGDFAQEIELAERMRRIEKTVKEQINCTPD